MSDSELYDPSTACDAYFDGRTGRAIGRLWVSDKTIKDWGQLGIVRYFQGAGTNPTTITGYANNKIWLRVSEGVTDEPAEVRAYSGGDATSLTNWPLLTPSAFGAHIALDASAYNEDIGVFRPEDYGAVGNGVANDTAAWVELLSEIGDYQTVECAPGAIYLVDADALKLPNLSVDFIRASIICKGGMATLKARTVGKAILAPENWHNNSTTVCTPWSFQNINFDGDDKADFGLVCYGYLWLVDACNTIDTRLVGFFNPRTTKNGTTTTTAYSIAPQFSHCWSRVPKGWAEALSTNTGNGAIGTVTKTAGIYPGRYTVRMTSATEFTVTDPAGATVGTGTVGSTFTGTVDLGTISFTISAGATPFVSGDGFDIGVTAMWATWGGSSLQGPTDGKMAQFEAGGNYLANSTANYADYCFYVTSSAGHIITDNNVWGGKLAGLFDRQLYREGCIEGNSFEDPVYFAMCVSTGSVVIGSNKFRHKVHYIGNGISGQRETLVINGAHFQNNGPSLVPAWIESSSTSVQKRVILNNPVFEGTKAESIVRNHSDSIIIIRNPTFEGEGTYEGRISTSETERFGWIPSMGGAPSGTPVNYNSFAPMVVDVLNNRLYVHNGSAWKYATLS